MYAYFSVRITKQYKVMKSYKAKKIELISTNVSVTKVVEKKPSRHSYKWQKSQIK